MAAPDDPWLRAAWAVVGPALPPPPASVLDIGCGKLGGFVPTLRAHGYDAVGIDPQAPEGPDYRQAPFEDADVPGPVDAIVASASLHHVADLDDVLDRVARALRPGGTLVVLEWAWERFDAATAAWCFARLPPETEEPHWLHHFRERWLQSGEDWDTFFPATMADHGLHRGERVVTALEDRFEADIVETGPFVFPDLDGVSEADERAAIDGGEIQATGIRYVSSAR